MLVHQKRTYETFASELLKHQKLLASLRAVATDGEEQLSNAFAEAARLLCSFHERDNIKMKLRDLCVPERDNSKEIMNSIFNYQIEDTLHLGLIDSSDANDF